MFNPLEIKLACPTMIVHGIVSQIFFQCSNAKKIYSRKTIRYTFTHRKFDTHGVIKMYLCCNSTFINPNY